MAYDESTHNHMQSDVNFEHFGHWLDGGTQDWILIYHLMMLR
jgi:hypothetical protein